MNGCAAEYKNQKPSQENRRIRAAAQASLTLEAALVLPLYLMACVVLISVMNAVRIQGERNLELSNKARKMAAAASLAGERADGFWIDISSNYYYRYPFSVPGAEGVRIATRARVYPWVGADADAFSEGTGGAGASMVYVTENESVYHTHADCSHLDLTIIKTTTDEVGSLRNADGGKYKPCSGFPKGYEGPVYVSESGDYYYPTENYGSLTRHVSIVSADECGNLPLCTRCAQMDAREGKTR
ncbi:MAG: hypothetical protein PUC99_09415 [Eubacteriales bacterium]|nr:hypothetical protein [Eubacteriales bacterium]